MRVWNELELKSWNHWHCFVFFSVSRENRKHREIRLKAQEALKAIGCTEDPQCSERRTGKGQHVINNGVLSFHRGVLEDLLTKVGGACLDIDDIKRLLPDLAVSLNKYDKDIISGMVVHFADDEDYIDYSAYVYGVTVYNLKPRNALLKYLKKRTSVEQGEDRCASRHANDVRDIVNNMNEYEVYVDPTARDRWVAMNGSHTYVECKQKVQRMFENILRDFNKVVDKIRWFCKNNNWN